MSNYEIKKLNPKETGRSMRKMIGILAFALPTVLLLLSLSSKVGIQPSISHFNFTNAREIFTGILAAVGLMMLCYKTQPDFYDLIGSLKYKTEQKLAVLAGILALCVALFPTSPIIKKFNPHHLKDLDQYTLNSLFTSAEIPYNKLNATIHTTSAVLLFGILAIFCLYIFPTPKQILKNLNGSDREFLAQNNLKYTVSGVLIISGILLALFGNLILDTDLKIYYTTLIGETIALYAFGYSWFVKGREDEELEKIAPTNKTNKKEAEYA